MLPLRSLTVVRVGQSSAHNQEQNVVCKLNSPSLQLNKTTKQLDNGGESDTRGQLTQQRQRNNQHKQNKKEKKENYLLAKLTCC